MSLISPPPKNESKEHYELKQIAKYLAKHKGCQIIADEVYGFKDKDIKMNSHKKGIVDVAGIKIVDKKYNELPNIISYGFESKATLSDFKNGFNAGADYNYIIAPIGIIPKELIPTGIGFYEVDLNNYKIYRTQTEGITLLKKPSNRGKGRHYKTKFKQMQYVASRSTNIELYKNCKININFKDYN